MGLTPQAQREILRQNCFALFPYLIEITNTKTNEVFRYVNLPEDVTYNDTVYTSKPFFLRPYERTRSGIGNGSLTIYDAGIEWIPIIRNTSPRFKMKFMAKIYMQTEEGYDVEDIENLECELSNFSWGDDDVISCTMLFDEDMNIVMPVDTLSSTICPALF